MYPLEDWLTLPRGYRFGDPTFYNTKHVGVDILIDENTPIYAHMPGEVVVARGRQGGLTIHFTTSHGVFRYMHLNKFGKAGKVEVGEVIGYTGNTGEFTTGPHLHSDYTKDGEFTDVEEYFVNFHKMEKWEEKALKWAKENKVIEYPDQAPFTPKQTAWLAEVFRKKKA